MDTERIVAIGPLSPPITGPGLKNKYIKQGLEQRGFKVTWINTLERSLETVVALLRQTRDACRFLVSASTKARLGATLILSRKLADPAVHSALLPAGGSFATELRNLPPGIRGIYLDWFSQFDCILPQSDDISKELSELLDSGVLISTLPNLRPVPDQPPDFDQFNEADRPLRLVYVGRIKETKGLHYLLAAINNINDADNKAKLDIFGHFLEGDDYEERFRELCDFTPGARFLGKLDNDEVIQRLRGYDVFAFPTYYSGEGFPGVLVEAFAGGCLVLASDWNYNRQLISDGYDGLLFEPQSSASILERIKWLLENPEKVDEYKQHSWENADNYSIETVTGELKTYLEQSGW